MTLAPQARADAATIWHYHRLNHAPRTTDAGIGLGSHDLGVADHAARLWHEGRFPLLVLTGANAPTTRERFPRGEAVHLRERVLALGVPDAAVLVEPTATNTAENLTRSRDLLAAGGRFPRSVTLVTRPYQQRRAYATCRRQWPEVDVVCAAEDVGLDEYLAREGTGRVLHMLVGDTVRIERYAAAGHAIPQELPDDVRAACDRLAAAGYTARLPT